jgi:hypothetical protein
MWLKYLKIKLVSLYVLLEADDGNVSILHRGQSFLVTVCNYDVSNTTFVQSNRRNIGPFLYGRPQCFFPLFGCCWYCICNNIRVAQSLWAIGYELDEQRYWFRFYRCSLSVGYLRGSQTHPASCPVGSENFWFGELWFGKIIVPMASMGDDDPQKLYNRHTAQSVLLRQGFNFILLE